MNLSLFFVRLRQNIIDPLIYCGPLYPFRKKFIIRYLYLLLERFILKRNILLTGPVEVKLNTGYRCNLRCPHCPTGLKHPGFAKDLSYSDLKFIDDRISNVSKILLFGFAEPFLNKEIFKIIDYLQKTKRYIFMDSNLSISDEAILGRIEQSPINFLSISLDGTNQETYQFYRHGGNFDKVIANIERLRRSPNGPRKIDWQYIINKESAGFVDTAKKMAKDLGVQITFISFGCCMEFFTNYTEEFKKKWLPANSLVEGEKSKYGHFRKRSCRYLYSGDPYIDTDGRIYPCCFSVWAPQKFIDAGYTNIFGNLKDNTLDEIWNNDFYQFSRAAFSGKKYNGRVKKTICLKCKVLYYSLGLEPEDIEEFSSQDDINKYLQEIKDSATR